MKQSRTCVLLAVLISTVAVCGQQVVSGGSSPADTLYAQPGKLVSVNGFRLNLYCMGSGSPTVVFDSGWEDWAPAWSTVQPEVAKWTRACSYDTCEALSFFQGGGMGRPDRRISDIAPHAAVDCAHGIRMLLGVGNDFHCCCSVTHLDQHKAKRLGDCGRIDET